MNLHCGPCLLGIYNGSRRTTKASRYDDVSDIFNMRSVMTSQKGGGGPESSNG